MKNKFFTAVTVFFTLCRCFGSNSYLHFERQRHEFWCNSGFLGSGTVVLSASGSRSTGGIMLPSINGTVSAAQFTVTGEPGFTYAITLPTDFILYDSGYFHP
jgi:hypothetical protein